MDTTLRGSVVLFESIYTLHNTIASGKVLTETNHSWPFRVAIPHHPIAPDAGRPDNFDRFEPAPGFLSNQGDISSHLLPGSFACADKFSYDQFVEYVLKAQLRFAGEGTKLESTLPLNIQPLGNPSPITSTSFGSSYSRPRYCFVKSPRCLPENASKSLSFRDTIKSKMSGRTPQYAFSVGVVAPKVLQLHHPDPFCFPFKVYVTPKFGKEFSNFGDGDPQNMPPTVFKRLRLKLVAHIKYRAPSIFDMSAEAREVKHEYLVPQGFPEAVVPILMPLHLLPDYQWATGEAPTKKVPSWSTLQPENAPLAVDESQALDLGALLQLQPHRVRTPQPHPSFATYNLALEYSLDYKIGMQTVDHHHQLKGSMPITLLAPSEETQEERRADRAFHQPDRNDDILEWQRMTGARNFKGNIERLFGVERVA